jgi:GNAT superfamily N-acetyltransferase
MGLSVSPAATPSGLGELLRARGLHCRKHFPAMVRPVESPMPLKEQPEGLEIRQVDDMAEFLRHAHPSLGPITTPFRRYAFEGMRALIAQRPRRTWPFVAWLEGRPVASSLLHMSAECAGLHDLTVVREQRGRGIGAALLEQTCDEATRRGATAMVLEATSDGERLYRKRGFVEVARFAYWYRRLAAT